MPKPAIRALLLPALLLPALLLAACGQRTDLKPRPGRPLPPAPYGRPDQLSPRELLGQGSQARPGNSVELRTKSEPRADDPYDLPPTK